MKSMRCRHLASLLALALSVESVGSLRAEKPAVATRAPAWSLTTLDGKPIGLGELKGKVVVVDFWATWCPPCLLEIPGYIALQKKYGDRGLVIVGLSVDQKGPRFVEDFAKAKGINYPIAMATKEVVDAFGGVDGIPTTFLIDREGLIRDKKVGAMETGDYEKLIQPLL